MAYALSAKGEENIGAAAVELSAEDPREIDTAASKIKVRGAGLPEGALAMTDRRAFGVTKGVKTMPQAH